MPVRNGGQDFRDCLQALMDAGGRACEVIVVDDSSSDASAAVAHSLGARVISLAGGPYGPGVARNRGAAEAAGDIVLFLDADVRVHADTLARATGYFAANPDLHALFGSYDDAPPKAGLVSRYKNLSHHYVHQHGRREASTFWAGCGAVRRDVFLAVGGFSSAYARPSIEDIELGARLRAAGYRVWLCPDVQVAHLKRWTMRSLLKSDILDRAIPWTRLILSTGIPNDLNLGTASRLSALAACGLLALLPLGLLQPWAWLAAAALAALLLALNHDQYRFYLRRGGLPFAVGAVALHVLYLAYSSAVFGGLLLINLVQKLYARLRGVRPAAAPGIAGGAGKKP